MPLGQGLPGRIHRSIYAASKMFKMLGSRGVGLVVGVVTEGRSGTVASFSTALAISFVRRGSEGSSSGVGSTTGVVCGSEVSSGWAGGSLVAAVHGSVWGGEAEVVGKGVAASVVLGMGVGLDSGVSSIVGLLMGGAEVAATGSSCGFGPAYS